MFVECYGKSSYLLGYAEIARVSGRSFATVFFVCCTLAVLHDGGMIDVVPQLV